MIPRQAGGSHVRPRRAIRNRGSWQSIGLQQWYPFVNGFTGAALERVSNTWSPAQTVNGPLPYVWGGEFGWARDFDSGRVDGIQCPDIAVTQGLTVSIWTTIESSTNNGHLYSRHPGWFLSKTGATNVRFAVHNGTTEVSVNFDTITNLADGRMHNLVATYDGVDIRTFVDGVFKNLSSQTGNIDTSGTTGLGYYRGSPVSGSFAWDGQIVEARMYDRALRSNEVSALADPRTRWDLYKAPMRRALDVAAAAAGGGGVKQLLTLGVG